MQFCEDCGHEMELHGPKGCTETINVLIEDSGYAAMAAERPCGCEAYEFIEEESSQLEAPGLEHPLSETA